MSCCSQYGYCGVTIDYCGTGCQSNCKVVTSPSPSPLPSPPPSPSPSPPPTVVVPAGRCGSAYGNAQCADLSCCSQYGYCGITSGFCGTGCQSNCNTVTGFFTQCVNSKQVALTFDDGVSQYTDTLLQYLQTSNVKATFFVLGQNLLSSSSKTTLKNMVAQGHNIASHSYTHPDLTKLTSSQVTLELKQTDDLIRSIVGFSPKYFRPPYLAYNYYVDQVVKSFGYTTIMVGLDSNDWMYESSNPQMIFNTIVNNFNTGSPIVLQHDRYLSSINLVPDIIKNIKSQNYTIVNMDTCLTKL